MKSKGFTLIELAIVVAILGILIAVGTSAFKRFNGNDTQTRGVQSGPAPVSVLCLSGFKFSADGKQMVDENGHGIKCE